MSKEILVCVSGYFNPLHKGHLEYFRKSKELGDKLVVIVNNDNQAILKHGSSFMKDKDRLEIIRALKVVDFAILSVDEDRTVCKTLEIINPDIFANGGDQFNTSIPEAEVCMSNNIKLADGLGGKIESSSWLLKRANEKKTI